MANIKILGGYIWKFLNSKIFFIGLAIVMAFFFIQSFNGSKELKRQQKISEQNYKASLAIIENIRTENGGLISSIDSYILTEKELKEQNKNLSDNLKEVKGDLVTANRTVFKLEQNVDELEEKLDKLKKELGKATKVNDSTWKMDWSLQYNYDSLNYDLVKGQTLVGVYKLGKVYNVKHLDTKLLKRETQMELTFGQRIKDGQFNVYLQTNYPGFSPQIMEGTFIDPNENKLIKSLLKKRMFLPNTWNLGVGATVGYDFLHLQPAIVVGFNVTYSLYQW